MTKGQQFANEMRYTLSIGTRTRRYRKGVDLHAEILDCIRNAFTYPGFYSETRAQLFTSALGAYAAYNKHIAGYRADAQVITHVKSLSPYQFCNLIGRMVDAKVSNAGESERFFAEMARTLHAQAA